MKRDGRGREFLDYPKILIGRVHQPVSQLDYEAVETYHFGAKREKATNPLIFHALGDVESHTSTKMDDNLSIRTRPDVWLF